MSGSEWRIEVQDRQAVVVIDPQRLIEAVRQVLRQESVAAAEINVALVDDDEMQQLNRRYLEHDYPTDVLSFTYASPPRLEGELVIGAERAKRVAAENGTDRQAELLWYVVHGTLHLVGFDDATDELRREMRLREAVAMRALGQEWPLEREGLPQEDSVT